MRLVLAGIVFSVVSSNCVDYAVWNHPIAVSGTCAEVTHDGLCTRINVWHVYKGKTLIPSSVMTTQSVNNFDTSVIYKLNAENLRKRFRLHQTRILYGSIRDDVFVLEPQVNNVFLNNLERVANIVRIQSSNPNLTADELIGLGINISFECDAKLKINEPPPATNTVDSIPVTEIPATTDKVREIENEIMVPEENEESQTEKPRIHVTQSEILVTEVPAVTNKMAEIPEVEEPAPVPIETASSGQKVTQPQPTVAAEEHVDQDVEEHVDSENNFDRDSSSLSEVLPRSTSLPNIHDAHTTPSATTTSFEEKLDSQDEIVVPEVEPLNQAAPEAQAQTTAAPAEAELPISHQTTEEQEHVIQCTYGSWEDWSLCDCNITPPSRSRTLQGFGKDCENKQAIETCGADCEGSGSGDWLNADDNEYDRDDEFAEELSRATRDRYRRNVDEADLTSWTENESSELYIMTA